MPEFQSFLVSRNLVPEKKSPFYAHWVSKFLAFSNRNKDLGIDLRIKKFLNHLGSQKNISDWQLKQADEAVQLYIYNFLKGETSNLYSNLKQLKRKSFDISKILNSMRQAIRIKHYSYRTEHSYIDWVKRFFEYTTSSQELSP